MEKENRINTRVPLLATLSISDHHKICEADVVNVSFGGVAVEHMLSSMMNDLPKLFTAIIYYREFNAKIKLYPRWYRKEINNYYVTVGLKIAGNDNLWDNFLLRTTSLTKQLYRNNIGDDVWGPSDLKYTYK